MGNRDRAGGRLARSIPNRSGGPFPKGAGQRRHRVAGRASQAGQRRPEGMRHGRAFSLSYKMLSKFAHPTAMRILPAPPNDKVRPLYRSRRCKFRSCARVTMLSQLFRRSTTIRRNSFGYRPIRLYAARSSFPCKVCLSECLGLRGQSKSGKHALLGAPSMPPLEAPLPVFDCVSRASHASTNQRRFIAACWEPKLAPCVVGGDRERR